MSDTSAGTPRRSIFRIPAGFWMKDIILKRVVPILLLTYSTYNPWLSYIDWARYELPRLISSFAPFWPPEAIDPLRAGEAIVFILVTIGGVMIWRYILIKARQGYGASMVVMVGMLLFAIVLLYGLVAIRAIPVDTVWLPFAGETIFGLMVGKAFSLNVIDFRLTRTSGSLITGTEESVSVVSDADGHGHR